jgi:hypothetical protein
MALLAAGAQRDQLAAADVRQRRADGDEHHVDLPADHVLHAQRAAAVRECG